MMGRHTGRTARARRRRLGPAVLLPLLLACAGATQAQAPANTRAPAKATATTPQLPATVRDRIAALAADGDALAKRGKYRDAVERYIAALQLLPEPLTRWPACTRLLGAIGEANVRSGNFEQARSALSDAMHCPGAIGNPRLHLRLGQAQYELGNLPRANDELARAYMGGGKEIFAGEDPKYFAHLKTVLRPPANGQW